MPLPLPVYPDSLDNRGNLNQKPSLMKYPAVDVNNEGKKLTRGISRTAENAGIISQVRNEMLIDVDEANSQPNCQINTLETNDCTFTLPDLSTLSDEFRGFLENELIDRSMSLSLHDASRLNWWTSLGEGCEKLWPLSTTGDGNCLLHAASLGMWGFHDRLLILRRALHACLTTGTFRQALWRRWRWQNARSNLQAELGLYLNEEEWQCEWHSILKLASSRPRTSGSSTPNASDPEASDAEHLNGSKTYESLEEIHVLALAHVLKRPIIVIAHTVLKDVNGEALAPIKFGGIYLPLEIEASECSRSPLVLAYDAAHFSALVAMTRKTQSSEPPAVLSLVDVDRELLPIQFEVDPGESCVWNRDESDEAIVQRIALTHEDRLSLLNQFFDLVDIPCPSPIKTNPKNKSEKNKQESKVNGIGSRSSQDCEGWNSDNECNGVRGGGGGGCSPSSKPAGKQLQHVARQFGSLGRSVGRRIKRNLLDNFVVKHASVGPMAARMSDCQWECPDFILCARLHTEKQHPCLEQMISNYLQSARHRFEQQQSERQRQSLVWQHRKQHTLAEMALQEGPSPCINPDCSMFGTALTSYMCTACYSKQLEQEEERAKTLKSSTKPSSPSTSLTPLTPLTSLTPLTPLTSLTPLIPLTPPAQHHALYGTGKSVFYASSDGASYTEAANLPSRKPPSAHNGTLYLSNSTFFGDGSAKTEAQEVKETPKNLIFESSIEPALALDNPRRLSHYDSIRKVCKSSGCSSYGQANCNWFCAECFHIRKKAAVARESILEGMRAAQMQ